MARAGGEGQQNSQRVWLEREERKLKLGVITEAFGAVPERRRRRLMGGESSWGQEWRAGREQHRVATEAESLEVSQEVSRRALTAQGSRCPPSHCAVHLAMAPQRLLQGLSTSAWGRLSPSRTKVPSTSSSRHRLLLQAFSSAQRKASEVSHSPLWTQKSDTA